MRAPGLENSLNCVIPICDEKKNQGLREMEVGAVKKGSLMTIAFDDLDLSTVGALCGPS